MEAKLFIGSHGGSVAIISKVLLTCMKNSRKWFLAGMVDSKHLAIKDSPILYRWYLAVCSDRKITSSIAPIVIYVYN